MNWLAEQLETRRTEQGGNIAPMEGLRGFAVALVFAVHYAGLFEPWFSERATTSAILVGIHSFGQCGVDLFFFLSGFLIYGSLLCRRQPFLNYMGRRVRRIYPTFLVVFVVYLVLSFLIPDENKIPHSLLGGGWFLVSNLLLLPGVFDLPTLISVAWSLSFELCFYLAIPVIISLGRFRSMSRTGRVVALCILAILAVTAYDLVGGGPIRLVMFLGGALVFETSKSQKKPQFHAWFAIVIFVVALTAFFTEKVAPLQTVLRTGVLFVALYVLCVACLTSTTTWLARVMTFTPLRWLGNMSYSYYLIHGLTIKAVLLVISRVWPATGAREPGMLLVFLPPMFLVTLITSLALFVLVERRFSLTSRKGPRAPLRAATQSLEVKPPVAELGRP
jgi:peptidoglycan/LPS O-acetylase OafA/YrhL